MEMENTPYAFTVLYGFDTRIKLCIGDNTISSIILYSSKTDQQLYFTTYF